MVSKEELLQFEEEIAQLFLEKKIRFPIHLSKGNEDQLIEIFNRFQIGKDDWVFSTHRSHYHALLKGIPKEWLRDEILAGNSIHINNKEHNFFTSAIVGGICPVAVGVALAIKMKGEDRRVFVFVGDMASETGIFHESVKYSENLNLSLIWIIEDNGYSTNTPTKEVWGTKGEYFEGQVNNIIRYKYERGYPHTGTGEWVTF